MATFRQKKTPSIARRFLFIILILLFLLLTTTLVLSFTPWNISPPDELREPVTIYVLDYGRHSRLALPFESGAVVEYSTGEWHYYALRKRNPWRIIIAMSGVSRASLARRVLSEPTPEMPFPDMTRALRTREIEVEQERVSRLLAHLEEEWQRNLDSRIYYPDSRMSFVDEGGAYHLFSNSNHQVALWLEFLGCTIEGQPILSNFKVEKHGENASSTEQTLPQLAKDPG